MAQANRRAAVRTVLKNHPDGLSVHEINKVLGYDPNDDTTRKTLSVMPDVYIDRWERALSMNYRAVYCIVDVPENCPHPLKQKELS